MNTYEQVQESCAYIASIIGDSMRPTIAITLGTGLGSLSTALSGSIAISYIDVPHMMSSTVESHSGRFIIGEMGGHTVLLLDGRLHYYEGYSAAQVAYPVYIAAALGCEIYLATNASGGLHPDYSAGDIITVRDHINMHPDHPLRGRNDDRIGLRFPDMLDAYDPVLRRELEVASSRAGLPYREGVYLGLQGPSLETPAEYLMYHRLGADLIGMSTIHEVIAGRHVGLRCAVLSVVSNVCLPVERLSPTDIESVVSTVDSAAPRVRLLVQEWLQLSASSKDHQ